MLKICGTGPETKHVPPFAFSANETFLKALVDGYISGVGTVSIRGHCIKAVSVSEVLIDGMAIILNRFGILLRKAILKNNNGYLSSYQMTITDADAKLFAETFSLTTENKQENLSKILLHKFRYSGHGKLDMIPGVKTSFISGDFHRDQILEMLKQRTLTLEDRKILEECLKQNVYFDPIVSIEEVPSSHSHVYDLTVANTRNFSIFNGIAQEDTFHFAGLDIAHVTVGIPRLIELFMVGHTKTVLTTLPILPKHKKERDIKKFAASISTVSFDDVLEYIDIEEKIHFNPESNMYDRTILLSIKFDMEEITKYYNITVEHFWSTVELILVESISFAFQNVVNSGKLKVQSSSKHKYAEINQKIKNSSVASDEQDVKMSDNLYEGMGNAPDNDSSMKDIYEISENEEMAPKKNKKKKKNADDDSDQEEDDDKEDSEEDEETLDDEVQNNQNKEDEEDKQEHSVSKKKFAFVRIESIEKEKGILRLYITSAVHGARLFLKDVVKNVCEKTFIRSYKSIGKVNVIQKDHTFELQMEGYNMLEILSIPNAKDYIDFNAVITNDINATVETLGIEAAYQLLVNEIKNVFKLYGIPVDERHICLIAEHMTNTGAYLACNRRSMLVSPGVFHKATFESAVNFLGSSTAYAESDKMTGPSSQLIFGKPVNQGTGSFDILFPIEK
jgi:hypothetical protein